MSLNLNACHFVGNLTADPSIFNFTNHTKATFRVAVNRPGGQADFVPCVLWDTPKLLPYLTKGLQVAITARFKTDSYEKDGVFVDRSHFVVTAIQMGQSPRGDETQSQPAEHLDVDAPPAEADLSIEDRHDVQG